MRTKNSLAMYSAGVFYTYGSSKYIGTIYSNSSSFKANDGSTFTKLYSRMYENSGEEAFADASLVMTPFLRFISGASHTYFELIIASGGSFSTSFNPQVVVSYDATDTDITEDDYTVKGTALSGNYVGLVNTSYGGAVTITITNTTQSVLKANRIGIFAKANTTYSSSYSPTTCKPFLVAIYKIDVSLAPGESKSFTFAFR